MANLTDGAPNLIDLLLEDHLKAKDLLGQIDDDGTDVAALFPAIVKELAIHEVAEEEVLYPAVRRWVDGGDALADARIAEQQEGEELLAAMEKMDVGSDEFMASLHELKAAVLEHAGHEETEVFPVLEQAATPEQLSSLGRAYTIAKAMAPTHPHPNAPNTPPGNILVGPAIAIVDRATDAIKAVLAKANS